MCGSCGCEKSEGATIVNLQTGRRTTMSDAFAHPEDNPGAAHAHTHSHAHGSHDHAHPPFITIIAMPGTIPMSRWTWKPEFWRRTMRWRIRTAPGSPGREILALNLVSSPGAGKTTLLERTIRDLKCGAADQRHRGRSGDGE